MSFVTKEDLQQWEKDVLQKVFDIIRVNNTDQEDWVKTNQAMKILGCSRGKIYSLREKGILKYKKLGGTYYYDMSSILDSIQ
jgi:hypothetical protein